MSVSLFKASGVLFLACLSVTIGHAQEPSAQLVKALSYTPRQESIEFEEIDRDRFGLCKIEEKTRDDGKGFWVTGPEGQPLRWFADTNRDNKLDQWSYYNNGIEVYRESDTDFNGKADTYRWLNAGGTRIGIDRDEDSDATIDYWDSISPEELTIELVNAIANEDQDLFETLLISNAEIALLSPGRDRRTYMIEKAGDARSAFSAWAAQQTQITKDSVWTNYSADRPSLEPAGTQGSEKDLLYYDNVVALFQESGQSKQLVVGAIAQVGNRWRLLQLPKIPADGAQVDSGVFSSVGHESEISVPTAEGEVSESMQRFASDLQTIDEKLQSGSGDKAALHSARADVLEKMIRESAGAENRTIWINQFAETVGAAAQLGEYPGGVRRLRDFTKKLEAINASPDEVAYVVFRAISAEYNYAMQQKDAKYEAIQKKYLADLVGFVRKYPSTKDSAEAMLQIALSAEFSGELKTAKSWYEKAAGGFADSLAGKKARGALSRLSMEGQRFRLKSQTIDGRNFDAAAMRGPVIYHSWASWCDGCKAEMRALKELQNKYAKEGLRIVGMNFDTDSAQGKSFLSQNSFPWVHLYEKDGLDSNMAVSLGILTLPVNFVVGKDGRVVKTGVHWTELDAVVEDLLE